jgi:hypothetical protein
MGSLPEPLPNLFGAETTDSIKTKTKHETVFLPNSNVESVVLRGDGAAIPTVTNRSCRTDQRTIPLPWPGLKVEKERGPSKKSSFAVPEENGWTPLGTAQGARFLPTCICKLFKAGNEFNCACVIETLKRLDEWSVDPEGCREGANSASVSVDIGT